MDEKAQPLQPLLFEQPGFRLLIGNHQLDNRVLMQIDSSHLVTLADIVAAVRNCQVRQEK